MLILQLLNQLLLSIDLISTQTLYGPRYHQTELYMTSTIRILSLEADCCQSLKSWAHFFFVPRTFEEQFSEFAVLPSFSFTALSTCYSCLKTLRISWFVNRVLAIHRFTDAESMTQSPLDTNALCKTLLTVHNYMSSQTVAKHFHATLFGV